VDEIALELEAARVRLVREGERDRGARGARLLRAAEKIDEALDELAAELVREEGARLSR
jgi:hypothetical protein